MTALPDEHPLGLDLLGDPARIAAVRRVLLGGTTATGLDRLTRLAADLLEAPRAQVSLLAEEQVIASIFGTDLPPDQRTGAVADSLCTVTVRLGAPFAVSDALTDERVRDLPPVTSGAVRAYLGVPLVATSGLTLGALCVYDDRSRIWTPRDVGLLSELASSAIAELELRAVSSEMATKAAQLDLALSAADTGSFDWDLSTEELHWDDRLIRLFGYQDSAEFGGHIDDFNARLHPDDRERVGESLGRIIAEVGDLSLEYRIVRPDGVRWIEARGRVLPGADGTAARVLGVARDSTELRHARDRLARLLETMSDAFISLDPQWRFTFVNPEAEKLLGRPGDELVGRVLWTEFPEAVGSLFEEQYRQAVDTGEPTSFESFYPPLDAWFEVRAWPTPDGLSVYFHEVSARRRAQEEREQAVAEREQAFAAAEAANARLSVLADASHTLGQSLEPAEVLQRLSEIVLPGLGDFLVVALVGDAAGAVLRRELPDGEDVHVVHVAHSRPEHLPALERLVRSLPLTTSAPIGVGAAIRTGQPEWLPQVPDDALVELAPDAAALDELRALRVGRALTVPLISRGRALGAVTVAEPTGGAVDRALLTDLAARAAVALDNALLYGAEKRTGLTLQRSLLPGDVPQLPGLEVAVRYRPGATGAFVGGDWYQGIVVGDELVLCMGDVMGHGMRSAARMGQLRAIVATLALEGHAPGSLLSRLAVNSDVLLDLELATMLVASYSPSRRTLAVASAGHPPPLLAELGKDPCFLEVPPGPPIGSLPGTYEEVEFEIGPGSTLVLYTDGLVEERDAALDTGLEALRSALQDVQLPPELVADHVLHTMGRSEGAADDVALLVLSHMPGA